MDLHFELVLLLLDLMEALHLGTVLLLLLPDLGVDLHLVLVLLFHDTGWPTFGPGSTGTGPYSGSTSGNISFATGACLCSNAIER